MAKSVRSKLNKIERDKISLKIHLSIDGEIVCGQKRPDLKNELDEWLTKGKLRCQRCLKKYNYEN